jgi:hypothetical protein
MKLFTLAALALFGVAHAESQSQALAANRAKWEEMKIADYHYTLWQWYGNGIHPSPIRVTVRNGDVVSARYVRYAFRPGVDLQFDISETEDADASSRRTILELFELAQQVMAQYEGQFEVTFDKTYGFPLTIYGNWPGASDAAQSYKVTDFEALK